MDDAETTASGDGAESHAVEDVDPADAFAALGNSTRVAILQAFREHYLANPNESAAAFSTLRKAVGLRDSGQFRYHLEQLRGTFVEKCDEGYRLTYAGSKVIDAIIAGTYTGRSRLGPITLDSTCSHCGTVARASYRDGILEVTCENDHPLFYWSVPPNAAIGNSLEELVELATTLAVQSHELVADGTCSECYSGVEPTVRTVETDGGDRSVRFFARCGACAATWEAPVGFVLLGHPEIESLYHQQGRPISGQYWWELEVVDRTEITILEESPLRVRLSVTIGETDVEATVDESARVVDLDCPANAG
ncbi:DUF7351 domain-containing protein [Natronorubrum sp. FCH18a]|uniref:DUF7351 domain-containing protein n=1 Tax=Natronorubrum sp. FCH18a TaxID=3447018 RepID=UPI003F5192AD